MLDFLKLHHFLPKFWFASFSPIKETRLFNDCLISPIASEIKNQENTHNKEGTMRLGLRDCELKDGKFSCNTYSTKKISERHKFGLTKGLRNYLMNMEWR